MKKILLSLLTIGIVGIAAVGGVVSYLSDKEISVGNTLAAAPELDITIDSMGTKFNGQLVPGTFWFPARHLTDEKFWTISDLKPGGVIQSTISLHLEGFNNPKVWACMFVQNKENNDNGLNEPETQAGDATGGAGEGELEQNIHVLGWRDNGNGIHDPSEPFLVDSFFDVFAKMPIADSTTGAPLDPSIPVEFVQLELCGGSHTVNPTSGVISCDGASMGNIVQTDSLKADLVFYAVDAEGNADFKCSDVQLPIGR